MNKGERYRVCFELMFLITGIILTVTGFYEDDHRWALWVGSTMDIVSGLVMLYFFIKSWIYDCCGSKGSAHENLIN